MTHDQPLPLDDLLRQWADAACSDWGYPAVTDEWHSTLTSRLPPGLRTSLMQAVNGGVVIPVEGHRFTLRGLGDGKGPYAFFSRSSREQPAPNWEYFVQAVEYARLWSTLAPQGVTVDFEDGLVDISVRDGERMLWGIEVKEKSSQLAPLLAGIKAHGAALDWSIPDRHDDGLRKAKYLLLRRPEHFSLMAIGQRLDFTVSYVDGSTFVLSEDVIPLG